jgi:exopolysaccharide biosynthesis protein
MRPATILRTALAISALVLPALVAPGATSPAAARVAATPAIAATSIETSRTSQTVAPGVEVGRIDRLETGGWLRANSLSVDLTKGATIGYTDAGAVAKAAPMTEQTTHRPRVVAAFNGDFFDINDTDAPLGVAISDGTLVKSPSADHTNAVGITAAGAGAILQVEFTGTVHLPGTDVPLAQLNGVRLPTDGIGEYTAVWGDVSRARPVQGAADTAEVIVSHGRVRSAAAAPGTTALASGAYALIGRDAGARTLRALRVGDPVTVAYAPRVSDGSRLRTAVGGNTLLVVDGVVQTPTDTSLAARTAVGFSGDGSRMYFLNVDGKQTDSVGIGVPEMARMMKEMGAENALNLDGGGSSTLLARQPGKAALTLRNSPSDGTVRPVANGLTVSVPAGSGRATGFDVAAPGDPITAPTADPAGTSTACSRDCRGR